MKHRSRSIIFLTIVLLNLICSVGYPCTTFVFRQNGKIVFGRNLDWITGSGLIMTNPRNLEKTALIDPSEKSIEWVSKYGSLTFNQIGRDLPYGGMNETGLVVEHMTLEETQYPFKDNRYAISANQWIQFQLDNYSTVSEVINSDSLLRIVDVTSKYHFLISDQFGNVATIEFLNGKMVCHTGYSLPIPVLANSSYDYSLKCYESGSTTSSDLSQYNFQTAANGINKYKSSSVDSIVNDAFHVLSSVSQGFGTKWSIVYDITNMKIYFKIFETPTIIGEKKIFMRQPGQVKIKSVDFKKFDFDCHAEAKVLDLYENITGAADNFFINYSSEINKEYISKAFKFFEDWGFNLNIGSEQIEYLANYPESFLCKIQR